MFCNLKSFNLNFRSFAMLYENPEERWSTVASFGTLNEDETDYVVF